MIMVWFKMAHLIRSYWELLTENLEGECTYR